MGLKDYLKEGGEVLGSPFDGKVKNRSDFDSTTAKRLGYMDADEFWTDKGYRRATTEDYARLREGNEALQDHIDQQHGK